MLGIIAKNQKEMFGATKYKKRDDTEGEYFEFYFSNHFDFDENSPVQGLKVSTGHVEISTSWAIDWEEDQYVEFMLNGIMTMWRIDQVLLNPNANRKAVNRVAYNPTAEFVLMLNKVGNPKAVIRE